MTGDSHAFRDYYEILQVHPRAQQDAIQPNYLRLLKKWDPEQIADDDPQRIAEYFAHTRLLNEAYAVLSDPFKRREYDAERRRRGYPSFSSRSTDGVPDYYELLDVHPRADQEAIDFNYRRLIRIWHPDRAGDDPEFVERAARLNKAYSVLRDPVTRQQYDEERLRRGWDDGPLVHRVPQAPGVPLYTPRPNQQADAASGQSAAASAGQTVQPPPPSSSKWPWPFDLLGAAYYLLPGPYEWEEGSRRELLTVGLLPIAGLVAFALLTHRLDPWIGQSFTATLMAWGLIVLLFLPMLTSLPRVIMAGAPCLVLLTGAASPMLHQYNVPMWFAWGMASLFSVVLAARLFVFGVLPTVAACWLITQIR